MPHCLWSWESAFELIAFFCITKLFCHVVYFWFFHNQGIGNGLPIGAVVTTPEIAQVLTQRSYFNTFGGNPVCTAGGLAVLRVLEKEKLQENACTVGSYLKERLISLQNKHESKVFFFLNDGSSKIKLTSTHNMSLNS